MLNLLFNIKPIYDILVLTIIFALIILMLKFKNIRVFILTALLFVFIGLSAVAGVNVNNYYSSEGGIKGKLDEFVQPKIEVKDLSFNLKNLSFKETPVENEYEVKIADNKVLELESKSYDVLVNSIPVAVYDGSEFIHCKYEYVFYNSNLKEILSDTLSINISFNKTTTEIVLITNGGSDAVKYWNDYFNKKEFIIELK